MLGSERQFLKSNVNDKEIAHTLSLDFGSKLVTALDYGIEDLLEVVEG